jgi:hypothetical protein
MYTAEMARSDALETASNELDRRIENAVKENQWAGRATVRIYIDDPFRYTIKEELEKRGFKNVDVPDIILKGDVSFEW